MCKVQANSVKFESKDVLSKHRMTQALSFWHLVFSKYGLHLFRRAMIFEKIINKKIEILSKMIIYIVQSEIYSY